MSKPYLSKSKYLVGLQCPKLLWIHYKAKDKLPPVDEQTEAIFDQGHQVGQLAQKLFPDGINIEWDINISEVIKTSTEMFAKRLPLFEAGFRHNRTYARVDILNPVSSNKWDIIEVKMGASIKDINYHDVAFQRYCYEGAGIPVNHCHLMHINTKYKRHGDIEPEKLLISEDVTEKIKELAEGVEERLQRMFDVIDSDKCPEVDIGPYCSDPHDCIMKDICWKKLFTHKNHVFTLANARGRNWKLYKEGILTNDNIPADFSLTGKTRIQVDAENTGQIHVEKPVVRKFLKKLKYPLYYLDFETFGYDLPIPLIDNAGPYKHIPFQYSLHYQRSAGSKLDHHSWIWDGNGDPRKEMLTRLQKLLGRRGSIVAYRSPFESSRLRESAEAYPEFADWVAGLMPRIVDLLEPFRNFEVYHPDQHGTASMKAVLPALTGKSYEGMAISDGGQASNDYVSVMFGKSTPAQKKALFRNLEEYCGQDSLGMADIVAELQKLI